MTGDQLYTLLVIILGKVVPALIYVFALYLLIQMCIGPYIDRKRHQFEKPFAIDVSAMSVELIVDFVKSARDGQLITADYVQALHEALSTRYGQYFIGDKNNAFNWKFYDASSFHQTYRWLDQEYGNPFIEVQEKKLGFLRKRAPYGTFSKMTITRKKVRDE